MPAIIIWAIVLAVVFLILEIPVSVTVGYKDDFILKVRVGLISVRILPRKKPKAPDPKKFTAKKYRRKLAKLEKKKQRAIARRKKRAEKKAERAKSKAEKKKRKEAKATDTEKPKSKPDVLEIIKLITNVALTFRKEFGKRFRAEASRLHIVIATDDAAKTAVLYGTVSQSIAYLMEILNSVTHFRYKKDEFSLTVDFCSDKIKVDVCFIFTVKVWHFAWIGIRTLLSFIKHGTAYMKTSKMKKAQADNNRSESTDKQAPDNDGGNDNSTKQRRKR